MKKGNTEWVAFVCEREREREGGDSAAEIQIPISRENVSFLARNVALKQV